MELNEKIDNLTFSIKKCVKTNLDLIKLEAVERSSVISGNIISMLVITLGILFFLFFISLGIGYYLSIFFDNNYEGFGLVGLFYLILSIFIYFNKNTLIEKPICNMMIRKQLNNKL